MDSAYITEFDLVSIEEGSAINSNTDLQTHLFEDRVMKVSSLYIGPECSIGNSSVALYDSKMGEGSKLGSLSLLMKGEELRARTEWEGVPAQRAA